MSRIIKAIINSAWPTENKWRIIFQIGNQQEIEIVKMLGGKFYSFDKNSADTNNLIKMISDKDLMHDLSIFPQYILNTSIIRYQGATQLSHVMRLPLVNLFLHLDNIKKEGAFSIAPEMNKNINLFLDETIPQRLFLTNYQIIDLKDIKSIVEKEVLKWK